MADKPTYETLAAGAIYSATKLNAIFDALASGVEGCLGRGGISESPNSMTGALDMDANKIQNLADPSNPQDAATKQWTEDNFGDAASISAGTHAINAAASAAAAATSETNAAASATEASEYAALAAITDIGTADARWVNEVDAVTAATADKVARRDSDGSLTAEEFLGTPVVPGGKEGSWECVPALDPSTAGYSGTLYNASAQNTNGGGITFKTDGSVMYVFDLDATGTATLFQYSLSTPWDVSTATYASKSLNVSAQTTSPVDLVIDVTGTSIYVTGGSAIFRYTMSTAWDLATASFADSYTSFGTDTGAAGARGISLYGNSLLVTGYTDKGIYEITPLLGSLTGAVYTGNSGTLPDVADTTHGIWMDSSHKALYVAEFGGTYKRIWLFSFGDFADLSTIYSTGRVISVAADTVSPTGVYVHPQTRQMFAAAFNNASVYDYNSLINFIPVQ